MEFCGPIIHPISFIPNIHWVTFYDLTSTFRWGVRIVRVSPSGAAIQEWFARRARNVPIEFSV